MQTSPQVFLRNATLEEKIAIRIVPNGECRECRGSHDPSGYARVMVLTVAEQRGGRA